MSPAGAPGPGASRPSTREVAYRLARRLGATALLRRRNRAPIFCFHNVVEAGEAAGDPSLHIPVDVFREYASWIGSTYSVVPLREVASRLAAGRDVAGLAAITFDDAYRGVLRHALPVLREAGLPSTIFVVSEASTKPDHFWWDLLGRLPGFTEADRDRCVVALGGDRSACLEAYGGSDAPRLGEDLLPSDWTELGALKDGVDFGVHTTTHRNLTTMSADEVAKDLRACREALVERLGAEVSTVSYPYGAYNPEVVAAAGEVGFSGGVILEGRAASDEDDSLMLPRINVPEGISVAALECRAVEVQRLKAWLG